MKINVRIRQGETPVTFYANIPTDLDTMIKRWSAEKVLALATDAAIIAAQAGYRTRRTRKENPLTHVQACTEMENGWAPGARSRDPVKKLNRIAGVLASLTAEQRAELGLPSGFTVTPSLVKAKRPSVSKK